MFINLSNHPSKKWSDKQRERAAEYGEIIDIPFPSVDPYFNERQIEEMAIDNVTKVLSMRPDAVLCQGEYSLTYLLSMLLIEAEIKVLIATTKRTSVESPNENGQIITTRVFEFIQFREVGVRGGK